MLAAPGTSLNISNAYYDQSGNVVVGPAQGLATAQLTNQLSQPVRMIQPVVINDVGQAAGRVANAPSGLRLFGQPQGQQQLTGIGNQGSLGYLTQNSAGNAMSGLQLSNGGVISNVGGTSGTLGSIGGSAGQPEGLISDLSRRQPVPMYGTSSSLGSLSVNSPQPSIGIPELQTPPLGSGFHVGSPIGSTMSQYLPSAAPGGDRKYTSALNGLSSAGLYSASPLSSSAFRGSRLKESTPKQTSRGFQK